MVQMIDKRGCSLCEAALPVHPLYEEERAFCCHGCQTVFAILAARGELKSGKHSPLYREAVRIGAINNPQFIPKERSSVEASSTLSLEVEEMWCPSCATLIEWIISTKQGVMHCRVDYATDIATLRYDPKKISKEEILANISLLGYSPNNLEKRVDVSFHASH